MTTTDSSDLPNNFKSMNDAADFWRNKIRVSTLPGRYKTKKPRVEWEDYEKIPPTKEQHDIWFKNGSYEGGIFIIPGAILDAKDNYSKDGPYIIGIDWDKQSAINEFCSKIFKVKSLSELANITLVEQHLDASDRGHGYLLSPFPFPNQPANKLGIEIKSASNGIMRVAPSMTEEGKRIEIIGTMEPKVLTMDDATEILQRLDKLFNDNGLGYLDKSKSKDGSGRITFTIRKMIRSLQITAEDKENIHIRQGYRHPTLVSIADSILINHLNKQKNNEVALHNFFIEINNTLCEPEGLPDYEIADIWDSAVIWSSDRILEQSGDNTVAEEKGNRRSKSGGGEEEEFPERAEFLKALYDAITEKFTFKSMIDSGEILYYDGESKIKIESEKLWPSVFERVVAYLSYSDDLDADLYPLTEGEREELVKRIRYRHPVERKEFDADSNIINVKNGLLNIVTRKLELHNPHHLSIRQFPVIYNPKARATKIIEFLNQVQDTNGIITLVKLFGYILLVDSVKYEKAFIFLGLGDNGKSVMIKIIQAFAGEENCSSVRLHDIHDDKFMIAEFYGKTVNAYADISSEDIEDAGTFKALVSGDTIKAQKKHRDPFDFRNKSKMVYSANKFPRSKDDSEFAYFKRWVIIPFTRFFKGINKDRNLDKKLLTEEELSGLLNIALSGLIKLEHDEGFEDIPIERIRMEVEREEVEFEGFLASECHIDVSKNAASNIFMSEKNLYESYVKYLSNKSGTEPIDKAQVEQALSRHSVFKKRREIGGHKVQCYNGIITREEAAQRNIQILKLKKQGTLNLDLNPGSDPGQSQ